MQTPTQRTVEHQSPGLPAWVGLCLFLVIAGFFLWEEHRAHLLGAVPYVLLLLCPAIHLFMHRGHNGHAGHSVPVTGARVENKQTES